jgi:hypothetical protein
MKNKSRGYNTPISARGFALNGALRSQGYIGQTSFRHRYIKTPFKGNYPVGHGGCLGTYVVNPIFACTQATNDATIIKTSTMNNLGHIKSSLLHPTDKCKEVVPAILLTTIQENKAGNYVSSESDYIKTLVTNVDRAALDISCNPIEPKLYSCNNNNKKTTNKNNNCGNYSKTLTSVSSGDYMNSIIYNKKCVSSK